MPELNPVTFAAAVEDLLKTDHAMPLGRGTPPVVHRDALSRLTPETIFAGVPPRRRESAGACLGALWLRFDFLEEAHSIFQAIENSAGSFGHAIMHRREGDFSNAKYWLRQARGQLFFPTLGLFAVETASPDLTVIANRLAAGRSWNAEVFVDLCSAAEANRSPCEDRATVAWLEQLQQREWELFFDTCVRAAIGHE